MYAYMYVIWTRAVIWQPFSIDTIEETRDLICRQSRGCKWIRIKRPGESSESNQLCPSSIRKVDVIRQWIVRKLRRFRARDIWRMASCNCIPRTSGQLIYHANNRGAVFALRQLWRNILITYICLYTIIRLIMSNHLGFFASQANLISKTRTHSSHDTHLRHLNEYNKLIQTQKHILFIYNMFFISLGSFVLCKNCHSWALFDWA